MLSLVLLRGFLFFVAIERLGEKQLAVSNIIRSVSTVFFVIVNSFAATTGSLVSNLIGAGEGEVCSGFVVKFSDWDMQSVFL